VVEHVARHATVIPVKLFTLFATDERALAHLGRRRAALVRTAARVAGRQEWGVRVRLDRDAAARRWRAEARAGADGATTGTRFLLLRRAERVARQTLASHGRADVEAAFETLASLADDARRRPPDQVEGGDRLVLDAAFLLPRGRAARFRAAARATAARLAGLGYQLTLTGPWPPYHFVGGQA
jgi:hypothetical protein